MKFLPTIDQPGSASEERKLVAERLAALAHPARIEIIQHLARRDACCNKDVVGRMDLAQSTVSQHLKVLVAAGLVRFSPERQRSMYSLDREALAGLSLTLGRLISDCCTMPAGNDGD